VPATWPGRARRLPRRIIFNRRGIMKKLTLPVDGLRVETFEAGDVLEAQGTVEARASGPGGACCTRINTGCNPDITNALTGACAC
jgi:hypothetical protein